MSSWMQTRSGIPFDLRDPTPDMVDPEDLAIHLSRIRRFLGASIWPYSVAQHSILVANEYAVSSKDPDVNQDMERYLLLHDAHEAYVGDLIRPVKDLLRETFPEFHQVWKAIEQKVQDVVYRRFGLRRPSSQEEELIHTWDTRMLCAERQHIMDDCPRVWEGLGDAQYSGFSAVTPWDETYCIARYLEEMQRLHII